MDDTFENVLYFLRHIINSILRLKEILAAMLCYYNNVVCSLWPQLFQFAHAEITLFLVFRHWGGLVLIIERAAYLNTSALISETCSLADPFFQCIVIAF